MDSVQWTEFLSNHSFLGVLCEAAERRTLLLRNRRSYFRTWPSAKYNAEFRCNPCKIRGTIVTRWVPGNSIAKRANSAIISLHKMDFDQLITFLEVARQGSFSRAGEKVFRSQSAVSAQIRQLEQEYGDRLLDRS